MKKKLAAILAGLLVLTMGTTVFAQTDGSPSVDSKAQEAEKYKQNISSIEISSGTFLSRRRSKGHGRGKS